ncbi:hypothetical protein JOC48_003881 [Aquibacillus albus]|uniref:Uncharacterized protein n=1 Tax=Aquibacillus albus TaxID=1168171 RepID=A0ABS2N5G4_9BACI|nr:hypothetical protein [Aquibacillus albus]
MDGYKKTWIAVIILTVLILIAIGMQILILDHK